MRDDNAEAELRELVAERNALLTDKPSHPWRKCVTWYQGWKQPKPSPLTGDMLSPSERATWRVMAVYRRWTVFLLLQVLTLVWWTNPKLFPGGLEGWNLLWSDLAVMVEMLVGIAFMNQSLRDARVVRKSLSELVCQHEQTQQLLTNQMAELAEMRSLHDALARHMGLAPEPRAVEGAGELGGVRRDDGAGGVAAVEEPPEDAGADRG
jgi:low affinity Fe/Cu permease